MKKDNLVYIQDIFDCLEKIVKYVGDTQRDDFINNDMQKDAVIRQFEIIGEATSRLSADFKDSYPEIPWQKIKDFRNLLIHHYDYIDIESVWDFIQEDLPDLKQKIMKLL